MTLGFVERGTLSLDIPVSDYLKNLEISSSKSATPTLRHLLTHTGGAPAGAYLVEPGEQAPRFVDFVDGTVALDATPGERWAYSNIGYAIVGQVLEDISGLAFDRLLDRMILTPLRMTSTTVTTEAVAKLPTGYWIDRGDIVAALSRDIVVRPAGAGISTPADIGALLAFLTFPEGDPNRPVSFETVASMFEPQDRYLGPAAAGTGLCFRLRSIDGTPVGWHSGRISGFPSALYTTLTDLVAL